MLGLIETSDIYFSRKINVESSYALEEDRLLRVVLEIQVIKRYYNILKVNYYYQRRERLSNYYKKIITKNEI